MGREHYVEIVDAGNIMPFGHEAVLIKITERNHMQAPEQPLIFKEQL
jgi:hypothetical protein